MLDEDPDYLHYPVFSDWYIVGDYSLTSPYEWYADNMLAYVVAALEQYTLDQLRVAGADDAELERARQQIDRAMQSVWSDFYHRNIGPEVYEYFASTFPIAEAGKAPLARRYISPLLLNDEG